MSEGYQVYDQNKLHYLTFQIVQWVDVFTRNEYKQVVVNSFDYCRKNKGLELYAYVIMTNHIHLIARTKEPFHLSDTIRDFKKFTANQLLLLMQQPVESRSVWIMKRFEFSAQTNNVIVITSYGHTKIMQKNYLHLIVYANLRFAYAVDLSGDYAKHTKHSTPSEGDLKIEVMAGS